MYKNKNKKIWKIFRFWKKWVFSKKYLFLDGQEKSNFHFFFKQILFLIRRRQKLPKYKFLWKKNGFILAKKWHTKKFFFSDKKWKSCPFLDGQGKIKFSKIFNQILCIIWGHPQLPKYKFSWKKSWKLDFSWPKIKTATFNGADCIC